MIVEGDGLFGTVPAVWRQAAVETVSRNVVEGSLPHRSSEEQKAIAGAFVGVTTWQQIVKHFRLEGAITL